MGLRMVIDFSKHLSSEGRRISKSNKMLVSQVDGTEYMVENPMNSNQYSVVRIAGVWRCGCYDHQVRGNVCKHIIATENFVIEGALSD